MTPNTAPFAEFVKASRSTAGLTQDNLHERGGPYRQMQGKVENGELHELDTPLLMQYDRAYGWPRGYAAAVAEAAAYASGDLPDGLPDENRPHLASLYKPDMRSFASPIIGFNAATGRPVGDDRPILTNISFDVLRAIVDSRAGTTLLDINVGDQHSLHEVAHGDLAAKRRRKLYRTTAPGEGPLAYSVGSCDPIAIDPLTDLDNMADARQLARGLLGMRSLSPAPTIEGAAVTFLAIAAFGKDPFDTITAIASGGPLLTEFIAFWETFRDEHSLGAHVTRPDRQACRLLDGVSQARVSALDLRISPPDEGRQRKPTYSPPTTMRSLVLTEPGQDRVVFYDSDTAPETPLCLNNSSIAAALTVYRVPTSEVRYSSPARMAPDYLPDGVLMRRSIGIATDVSDLTLVAHHRRDQLDTLTNLFGRYAVLCESGTAIVVWIPAA